MPATDVPYDPAVAADFTLQKGEDEVEAWDAYRMICGFAESALRPRWCSKSVASRPNP
jgi:hypothetical protein